MSGHLTEVSQPASPRVEPGPAQGAFEISNAIVRLLRARAGRGPVKAKASISPDLVVVTLRDCLTTAERTLVDAGHEALVMQLRDALHQALRAEATEAVEDVTGQRVTAYLTNQHANPDVAVIVFFLDPPGGAGRLSCVSA